mgnify:CR=1 FL=1
MSARSEYNMLADLGELLELYPNLTGIWEKDQDKFTSVWERNQEVLGNINIEDFEEL